MPLRMRVHDREPIGAALPQGALLGQPSFDGGKRLLFDSADPHATHLARPNPSALFKQTDVLHEGRQRHVERLRQLADARGAAAQPSQYGPASGIGNRLEDAVQRLRILLHAGHNITGNYLGQYLSNATL